MGYLVKSTIDGTIVTASAITITDSKLIDANSLATGNILEVNCGVSKLYAPPLLTIRLYVNTSNSLTGATLLATYTTASGLFETCLGRVIYIKSATNSQIFPSTTNGIINPDTATSLANSSININWTVNQYLIIALSHNSATINVSFSTFLLGLKR
jgi:hypothetical protein